MEERFEKLIPGPDTITRLLSQILDEPYPRINRKRSAEMADLDNKPPVDYSATDRLCTSPDYKRITYKGPCRCFLISRYQVLCSRFKHIPVTIIRQAMANRNNLFAPTYIHLNNLPSTSYTKLKAARGPNERAEAELRSGIGREVAVEAAWIESWLETRLSDEENKRRKKQEEDDAEAARQLNYLEHKANGGLLEW